MQVLFTCVPGHGHLNPMVPLALEFRDQGWDVVLTTGREMVSRAEALGFRCLPAGPTLVEMQDAALSSAEVRAALDTAPWVVAAAIFGGRARPVIEELADATLAPDLVVHDGMELAGPVLAAQHGVPWVTHGLGPRWPSLVEDEIPTFVDPVWHELGLEPPARGGLGHHAFIEICPPAVRSDNRQDQGRLIESRSTPLDEPRVDLAAYSDSDVPKVYCTLGTFTNSSVAVFRTIVEAVSELEIEVLLTTGWGLEANELGPLPANVVVENYVPQAQILGHTDLVVCHGGSGTMLASLAAGVPIVSLPQGADQFVNAPCWARSGAVEVVQPPDLDQASLAAAITSTLADPAYHDAAELTARNIAAMPSPSTVADALIQLASS